MRGTIFYLPEAANTKTVVGPFLTVVLLAM